MNSFEVGQVCDALQSQTVSSGNPIITQGEAGNNFYIIEEGSAEAFKSFDNLKTHKKVMDYGKGSYFGELALIINEPRQASIIAKVNESLRKIVSY